MIHPIFISRSTDSRDLYLKLEKNQKGIFEASRGLTLKFLRFFISFKNILIKIQSMLLHGFVPDWGDLISERKFQYWQMTKIRWSSSLSQLFLDHLMHTHIFFSVGFELKKCSMTWRSWREIKIRAMLGERWPLVKTRFSLMNKRILWDRLLHKGQTVHWTFNFKAEEGSLEQVFYALSKWSNFSLRNVVHFDRYGQLLPLIRWSLCLTTSVTEFFFVMFIIKPEASRKIR